MRQAPKQLHFPLAGIAKDASFRVSTEPTETRVYSSPMAVNVIGPCPFADRMRGGSRPSSWLGQPMPRPADVKYRARLVKSEGSVWMMSRTGKPTDFDFGIKTTRDTLDVSAAVAGNIALAGESGENITAFMPILDSMIFICSAHSIHLLTGEPTNGQKRIVSTQVGVVSEEAWCFDGQRIYFVGERGVYAMLPGESPIFLSAKLPRDLKGITNASLDYDSEYQGVHLYTDKGDWFYDIESKAFWKMDYKTAASKVVIGPFRLSQNDATDGLLDELTIAVGEGSSYVRVDMFAAPTAEASVALATMDGDSACYALVRPGFNGNIRPRLRGAWCCLRLASEGDWAYENILSISKLLGKLR